MVRNETFNATPKFGNTDSRLSIKFSFSVVTHNLEKMACMADFLNDAFGNIPRVGSIAPPSTSLDRSLISTIKWNLSDDINQCLNQKEFGVLVLKMVSIRLSVYSFSEKNSSWLTKQSFMTFPLYFEYNSNRLFKGQNQFKIYRKINPCSKNSVGNLKEPTVEDAWKDVGNFSNTIKVYYSNSF